MHVLFYLVLYIWIAVCFVLKVDVTENEAESEDDTESDDEGDDSTSSADEDSDERSEEEVEEEAEEEELTLLGSMKSGDQRNAKIKKKEKKKHAKMTAKKRASIKQEEVKWATCIYCIVMTLFSGEDARTKALLRHVS